ncbi:MAG: hypothetical protein A7316_10255 [Candidatus Altiarchaeales archaeon WOR_SM1_86-2]|nr:MAG: hypothetical protein A7316_10255 [Candidatus Altiarchaeales archaeon WOR_SM1_86-2]
MLAAGSIPAYPFMEAIKIPISICPHFSQGKPRGHYLLAKRLFLEDQPILVRQQYVGFNGFLLVTVVHPNQWDTTFKIANHIKEMDGQRIIWLGAVHQYLIPKGFKVYLPESIMQAGKPGRVEGTGIFRKYQAPGFNCYYLEVPKISAEVLLGRNELK